MGYSTAPRESQQIYILRHIKEIWEKFPELRLMQLIDIALSPDKGNYKSFYIEDDELVKALINFANKNER